MKNDDEKSCKNYKGLNLIPKSNKNNCIDHIILPENKILSENSIRGYLGGVGGSGTNFGISHFNSSGISGLALSFFHSDSFFSYSFAGFG